MVWTEKEKEMSSYQENEMKLKVIESMINFLMSNIQMRGFLPNGIVKADGQPDGKYLIGTAGEFYTLANTQGLETAAIELPEDIPSSTPVAELS
jgi:hypothetical protein